MDRREALTGCLLGLALGDAVGLVREGLSPGRAERLFGPPPLAPALLGRRGLGSDDTEHACMCAQALLASGGEPEAFARSLAWRLRGWLLGLPAGIGSATLRSILKLWLGFGPAKSGVHSAGNGPAMRAPLLGAALAFAPERLEAVVLASTRLTHRDPRADEGALLVARAAARAARGALPPARELLAALRVGLQGEELVRALELADAHLVRGEAPEVYARALGQERGVSGYVNHTVPAALYCWLGAPGDYRRAVESAVALGGDADTVAAVVGGLSGAEVGRARLPAEWLAAWVDWPRSIAWLEALAGRLAERFPEQGAPAQVGPLALTWPALLPRNLLFLAVVLAHGLRRLLPPYGARRTMRP